MFIDVASVNPSRLPGVVPDIVSDGAAVVKPERSTVVVVREPARTALL